MKLIVIAASRLIQRGVYLDAEGVGRILPTLWLVGRAGSGSSKTLASEEVDRIVSLGVTEQVNRLATSCGCTDAQWIGKPSENRCAFRFQDEVGRCFNAMQTQTNYRRKKDWCLAAFSHKPIANRLKSEKVKLSIEQPHFTIHGLSIDETWRLEVDLTSMLDGFFQRFSYYLAAPVLTRIYLIISFILKARRLIVAVRDCQKFGMLSARKMAQTVPTP